MDEPSFSPEEIRELMEILTGKGWLVSGKTHVEPTGGFALFQLSEKGRVLARGLLNAADDLDTNPRLLYLAAKILRPPN